jgi:hypothetical protein
MTEAEWLACEGPESMLEFLEGSVNDRKLRLLAVACCQSYRVYFTDERSTTAVEVASQVAEGSFEENERQRAFTAAHSAANWTYDSDMAAELAAYTCGDRIQLNEVPWRVMRAFAFDIYQNPRQLLCRLLRDIFPFHPITLSPSWLTSTVVSLANQMYDSRDFSAMPILADALQDCGCDNEEILTHCRGPGPHVKGCWAIDLLTGRE